MKTDNIETKEELQIIQDVENDNYIALNTDEFDTMKNQLQTAAANTIQKLSKKKSISIRLYEEDINKLKAIALHEGMPYQTYLTHMIHKITTGRVQLL
jgi:predicted DNA binding CopG/RHH family protein